MNTCADIRKHLWKPRHPPAHFLITRAAPSSALHLASSASRVATKLQRSSAANRCICSCG